MSSTALNNQKVCDRIKRKGYEPPTKDFVDVVLGGKLAFRFDPYRGLIEYQRRGERHIVDLAKIAEDQQ